MNLLERYRFSLAQAQEDVEKVISQCDLKKIRDYQSQSLSFLLSDSFANMPLYIHQETTEQIAGRCVGVIGSIALMEQDDRIYLIPIHEFKSHEVDLTLNEVLAVYAAEKRQLSLF